MTKCVSIRSDKRCPKANIASLVGIFSLWRRCCVRWIHIFPGFSKRLIQSVSRRHVLSRSPDDACEPYLPNYHAESQGKGVSGSRSHEHRNGEERKFLLGFLHCESAKMHGEPAFFLSLAESSFFRNRLCQFRQSISSNLLIFSQTSRTLAQMSGVLLLGRFEGVQDLRKLCSRIFEKFLFLASVSQNGASKKRDARFAGASDCRPSSFHIHQNLHTLSKASIFLFLKPFARSEFHRELVAFSY